VPECGAGASLDEPVGRLPLPEGHGVAERGAAGDDRAGCLDVGPSVDQRVEGLDLVAARGPVQRRFGMRPGEPGVDVGPASTSAATVAGQFGEWPGQSVAVWTRVHVVVAPSQWPWPILAVARCPRSSRLSSSTSPDVDRHGTLSR
jgi:hypothetical protein